MKIRQIGVHLAGDGLVISDQGGKASVLISGPDDVFELNALEIVRRDGSDTPQRVKRPTPEGGSNL